MAKAIASTLPNCLSFTPFFAVYFWYPSFWFGLVAAKTESAAIYFIATLASAATATATATAAARLVQVDSSTRRGPRAMSKNFESCHKINENGQQSPRGRGRDRAGRELESSTK